MKFCPMDATALIDKVFDGKTYKACAVCNFVNWNYPALVVVALVEYRSGLVMVKRGGEPALGKWCFPCGYVDSNESAFNALVREAREETGLTICPTELLGIFCPSPHKNQNLALYTASVLAGEMKPGSDSIEVATFHKDDIPDIAFPFHREVYRAWFEDDDLSRLGAYL